MSNTPARPCTTTALLWQNSLWWISTPSATCLSTGGSFRLWFATACRDSSTRRWQIASSMGEAYEPRPGCPINATIEVFGDRWSLLVLRDIVFGDRRYLRELQAGSEEGIASHILAGRLKRLAGLGLLTRGDTRAGQRARYRPANRAPRPAAGGHGEPVGQPGRRALPPLPVRGVGPGRSELRPGHHPGAVHRRMAARHQ